MALSLIDSIIAKYGAIPTLIVCCAQIIFPGVAAYHLILKNNNQPNPSTVILDIIITIVTTTTTTNSNIMQSKLGTLQRESSRTLIAFLFLLSVASLMSWVQLMNDNASLKAQIVRQPSLMDASQRLHGWRWVRPWMADVSLYLMVGGSAAGLLFGFCLVGKTAFALQIVRRFLWLMSLGYALRGLTLFGTILPPSNPSCRYVERSAWEAARAVPKLLAGNIHTCSDKIFSGHTLVATLLAAFWFHQAPPLLIVPRVYAASNWALMVVCSLGGRHHYTVDIVVGAIVALSLFHLYHLLVKMVVYENTLLSKDESVRLYLNKPVKQALIFMDGMDIRHQMYLSLLPMFKNDSKNDIKTISS